MNETTIVAMIATSGTEDFLQTALLGLAAAGIDPRIVYVARPDIAGEEIDPLLRRAGAHGIPFTMFCDAPPESMPQRYAQYGSPEFVSINWTKVRYLRWLLGQHRHVVYADVDVAWLGDPLWYLQAVARHYPLAFQTEGVRRFPPVLCWGFTSIKATDLSRRLLDTMLDRHDKRPLGSVALDEQVVCNAIVAEDPSWISQIYSLPEALFLNGLSYRGLLAEPAAAAPMHGELTPFTFHANWTTGLNNKRALMAQAGTWLLGD
jgi:hypothetical protein